MAKTKIQWTATWVDEMSPDRLALLKPLFRCSEDDGDEYNAQQRAALGGLPVRLPGFTFNGWIGCTRCSPGCEHCYAETMAKRAPNLVYGPAPGAPRASRAHLPVWGPKAPRRVTSASYWQQPLRWNRLAAEAGVKLRVFCASLSDVFEDVAGSPVNDANTMQEWRERLWALMEATPNLIWLVLTKRTENVDDMVPRSWVLRSGHLAPAWPRNVWLGFSGENQEWFDRRWHHAQHLPAPVIFASLEPLLGPVVLPREFLARRCWPIIGGESGAHARPFDLEWPRAILRQCREWPEPVPAFVKQMGSRPVFSGVARPGEPAPLRLRDGHGHFEVLLDDPHGGDPAEWLADLRVREFPPERLTLDVG